MRQFKLAKKVLKIDEVKLKNVVVHNMAPGQNRAMPRHGKDGMCYNFTDEDSMEYYGREKGTILSMWNVRGGKPHGPAYSLSAKHIFYSANCYAEPYEDMYGKELYNSIYKPNFYNQVNIVCNGVLKKELSLTLDINNPENIIAWKEKNYTVDSKRETANGRCYIMPEGKFYELDGDQSIKNMGFYKKGLKNKTWISKQSIEGNVNNLTELVFESNGQVITSLLRGDSLINETLSNKYFRTNDGQLHTTFKKTVVGKIHNGILM